MKICRFNGDRLGVVQDGEVFDVTGARKAVTTSCLRSSLSAAAAASGASTMERRVVWVMVVSSDWIVDERKF